jgi:hypothetical protein
MAFGLAFHILVGLANLQGFVERVQQFSVKRFSFSTLRKVEDPCEGG